MQFHDLQAQYRLLKPEIDAAMRRVVESGGFILGEDVKLLEQELAADVGRKHCVSCASGTDALILALMALGVGPGDAVFVPDFTYFASSGTATLLGAAIYPVDIDAATFNMRPAALEAAILAVEAQGQQRPKCIIPVDLFGLPADFDQIQAIAEKHGLLILEDAAQGYGGSLHGKPACSFGDISVTSFFPVKPLGCYGDGGAVFTDSDEQAELMISLRANGRSPLDKYDNVRIGFNSRLDTLQAAILRPKLKALREYELDALNAAAARYSEGLRDVCTVPVVPQGYTSSWAQYSILLKDGAERDGLQAYLKQQGIPSMLYYPRGIHAQKAYADRALPDLLYPNTCRACRCVLSLPMHPYLTREDQDRVIAAVRAYLEKREK